MSSSLPPGIYYERRRNRYRVRVYVGTRHVVHRTYHATEEEARAALQEARRKQAQVRAQRPASVLPDLTTLDSQVDALRAGVVDQ